MRETTLQFVLSRFLASSVCIDRHRLTLMQQQQPQPSRRDIQCRPIQFSLPSANRLRINASRRNRPQPFSSRRCSLMVYGLFVLVTYRNDR